MKSSARHPFALLIAWVVTKGLFHAENGKKKCEDKFYNKPVFLIDLLCGQFFHCLCMKIIAFVAIHGFVNPRNFFCGC